MRSLCPLVLQMTVNSVVDFFKTGKGVDLEVLTSATLSKLEEIKEKTATGQTHQIKGSGPDSGHDLISFHPQRTRVRVS